MPNNLEREAERRYPRKASDNSWRRTFIEGGEYALSLLESEAVIEAVASKMFERTNPTKRWEVAEHGVVAHYRDYAAMSIKAAIAAAKGRAGMNSEQIRSALSGVPDQQAEVDRLQILDTAPGSVGSQQVLAVFFKNGSIDYFDAAGKPVMMT